MPIPAQHSHRSVYHFSHIDNLPGLLRDGFLSNNHARFSHGSCRSIAASSIQARRAQMMVTCGPGGCVHDYVPLYFGSRSPMLLGVINAKNVDQHEILYFEFPISLINQANAVFTDASANTVIPPQFFSDPNDLAHLDWPAIDSLRWGNPDDAFRHRRMAELLVHNHLPLMAATRCVVWNDGVKQRVEQIVNGAPFPPIEFENRDRRHWFMDLENGTRSSLVTGPNAIKIIFSAAYDEVGRETGKHAHTAAFANLGRLLDGLRAGFGCLPQTAELVNLRSANGVHKLTVDAHTLDVVQRLLALPQYQALDNETKMLAEIAAYLHDIGKGPRSRWAKNGGLQKVDANHPVGAMPMMVEILTKHVATVSAAGARMLLKLVCYHDVVGDVLGKGRDERQIVDVVDSEAELAALFALGKADVTALAEEWWNEAAASQLYDRCRRAIEAKAEA